MKDRNFVSKHMRTFCKGAGAHVNQKRKSILDGYMDEDLEELNEGWDFTDDADEQDLSFVGLHQEPVIVGIFA